jgi:hypothetical protein
MASNVTRCQQGQVGVALLKTTYYEGLPSLYDGGRVQRAVEARMGKSPN